MIVSVKKGDAEIPGLTDKTIPRRLGPKRANKIRALFNLDKVSFNFEKKTCSTGSWDSILGSLEYRQLLSIYLLKYQLQRIVDFSD